MKSLLFRLGLAYTLLCSMRNLITTASTYLFDVGDLDRRTFATMQTISYFVIFLCKISSGPLLKRITGHNRLIGFFLFLQCIASAAYISLGIMGMTVRAASVAFAIGFIIVYCLVKWTASFTRVTILEMMYRLPKKPIESLGIVTTTLQVLTCLGDAGGKYALGWLLNMKGLQDYADHKKIPKWCLAMISIASVACLGIVATITLFRSVQQSPKPLRYTHEDPDKKWVSTRDMIARLICKPRFLLCCSINLLTSAVSVAMGSYGSHFMRYRAGIASEKVPFYDGISPFIILIGILVGGFLMSRYQRNMGRVFYLMFLPALFAIGILACLTFADHLTHRDILALYYTHQFMFYAYQNAIDGAYLMCVVDNVLAPSATGIVSGIGYIGGLIVPFTIMKYSTSFVGWTMILKTVFILECFLILPMGCLVILDIKKQKQRIQ